MTKAERKVFNYGQILGRLNTIARFNDKTNHVYDFTISRRSKIGSLEQILEKRTTYISESYKLHKIEDANLFNFFFKLLHDKWFYAYQNSNEHHLKDLGDNFSLYDTEWKKEWIQEFVDFTLKTLEPKNTYQIEYVDLKGYYASDYDEFVFECGEDVYFLSFTVTD